MYTLHNDTEAFVALINQISSEQSILPEIIEKDYFITLMLQDIAQKQTEYDVFFKGGTALYKALKRVNRFSEDIDLTFDNSKFATRSSKKTALKRVTSSYECLQLNKSDPGNISASGSRTSVYNYPTLFVVGRLQNDPLERIGKLKIETTTFTQSSPIISRDIEPLLYTYANDTFQKILDENYYVRPFPIKCITLERIFIDKLYAIEDYYLGTQANRHVEMAKHMYDVYQLFNLKEIKTLFKSNEAIFNLIQIKEQEQNNRNEAKTVGKSIHQFEYFNCLNDLNQFNNFETMQNIYVFRNEDKVEYTIVAEVFATIKALLLKML